MNWIGLFQAEVERNKLEAQRPAPVVKENPPLNLPRMIQITNQAQLTIIRPKLRGENRTLEYSKDQVGDPRVALFFALVRNIPHERLLELLEDCLQLIVHYPRESSQIIADLFILAFQTRDCRGGKGERSIFYQLLIELYQYYPNIVFALLPLIAEYGYYKDYFNILSQLSNNSPSSIQLQDAIIQLVTAQLKRDEEALARTNQTGEEVTAASISLCSKYAPRESHKFQRENKSLFRKLVMSLFPSTAATTSDIEEEQAYVRAKLLYRKMISH